MKYDSNKLKISIILGIMCCFLTAGIMLQLRTVKSSITTVGKTQAENELRDSVLRWKEKYDNAYAKLEKRETELEKLRNDVSNSKDSSTGLSSKLEKYNLLLGRTELVGKGLIITLKDGDSSPLKLSVSNVLVHDGDLLEVVNALKNAGAEAISINGQRITSRTAISCIGTVVTVNGEKIGAPFVIKAIGLPLQLYSSITMPGHYVDTLINDGVSVDIKQVDKETIVIPKYDGIYKLEYASNIE